jgi:glycosyltransferase involved in cell wall biosynthesis
MATTDLTCGAVEPPALNVLHIIDNLKLGGTQNLAWRTWREFSKLGLNTSVCVLTNSPNEHQWDWLPDNVFRINCHGDYRRPGAIRKWSSQVASVIDQAQPDLIHSWLWLSDVVAAGAAARRRLPHLVHVVDRRIWQESNRWKHRYRKWMTRRAFRNARSRFLAVSQAAAEFAINGLGIRPQDMGVAYNSIHVEEFNGIADSPVWTDNSQPLRLGIAARIVPEKGHRYLLDAVQILRDRGISLHLQITGDGPDRAMLEQTVAEYGLHDQVAFVGWVESVTEFLDGIDVFMVPSVDSEGLPTTILEAMAAGRAVVASDVGGVTEAIRDREDGIIVPPRNATALADAIESLASDRRSAASMVASARQRVAERFSMPTMMETIHKEYLNMIPAVRVHA